eukprot:scaffold5101_cov403-Prasinococcus_capsulatus_cf.AAC.2
MELRAGNVHGAQQVRVRGGVSRPHMRGGGLQGGLRHPRALLPARCVRLRSLLFWLALRRALRAWRIRGKRALDLAQQHGQHFPQSPVKPYRHGAAGGRYAGGALSVPERLEGLCVHRTGLQHARGVTATPRCEGARKVPNTNLVCAGCVNGVCMEPDTCICDPSYGGADCDQDMLDTFAQGIMDKIKMKDRSFSSLGLYKGTDRATWARLDQWLHALPRSMSITGSSLEAFVPLNDTLSGASRFVVKDEALRGMERYNRCAIVSDSASLKSVQLGSMIDGHDAVVRFNFAPTKGYGKFYGSKTTFRFLNRHVTSSTNIAKERRSTNGLHNKVMNPPKGNGKSKLSGGIPAIRNMLNLDSNSTLALWRPEAYHAYPMIRRKLPQVGPALIAYADGEDIILLRTDFLERMAALYVTLTRRIEATNILNLDSTLAGNEVSKKTRLRITPRLSTPMISVLSMIQLCKRVDLFGFDPESVRNKVSESMGLKSGSYYEEDNPNLYDLSREDDDSLQLAAASGPVLTGSVEDGQDHFEQELVVDSCDVRFPGHGKGNSAGVDLAILRLLEMQGHVQHCYLDRPQLCLVQHSDVGVA